MMTNTGIIFSKCKDCGFMTPPCELKFNPKIKGCIMGSTEQLNRENQ